MKKWIWLTALVVAVGVGLFLLGGAVFAQEPARAPVAVSGNWTDMADYCRDMMHDMMGGGMMGGDNMTGGGMMDGMMGMMGGGGMMGNGASGHGMMGR